MSESRLLRLEQRPIFIGELPKHTRLFRYHIGIPRHTSEPCHLTRKGTADHALRDGSGVIPYVRRPHHPCCNDVQPIRRVVTPPEDFTFWQLNPLEVWKHWNEEPRR